MLYSSLSPQRQVICQSEEVAQLAASTLMPLIAFFSGFITPPKRQVVAPFHSYHHHRHYYPPPRAAAVTIQHEYLRLTPLPPACFPSLSLPSVCLTDSIPLGWRFMYWAVPGHYSLEGLIVSQYHGSKQLVHFTDPITGISALIPQWTFIQQVGGRGGDGVVDLCSGQ